MSNISVTTVQNTIAVTETSGITVTTPEGQTIDVTVPNSSVNVTNTTDNITVLTAGTLIIEDAAGTIVSVNGQTGPIVVLDTDDIPEGTKKYFTQALARGSLSAGTGISYDSGTGVITNTSINTDTTYTIASASTTGGANLNLVGSDSSTDSVAYKGSGATTVTSTNANTITIASTDTNTTYTQNASSTTGGANLNLVGSDSTTDSIKLAGGTNVTVTRTDADTVTFSSTDTNTTYTQNFSSTTGGTNLNLVGSDATTDTVKFANGTGVTVAYTDDNTATISIGQSVGTGDSPSFAGITGGNITVGVDTDNTIGTTNTDGNIILDPNGTGNVVMTFANGGNLTNDRNYVSGIIRIPVAQTAGDIYGYSTGGLNPYRGISIDNTASSTTTTGKRTGMVMRNYANAPRNSIIGESARGTNPSAPTILTNNSNLIELVAGGYAATSDGTGFQATGCTITGTTLTIGTVTFGSPAVGQLLTSVTQGATVTAGTTITANISGSGSGSTWTVSAAQTVGSSTIWGGGDGWISSNNGQVGAIRLQAFENWTNQTSGTGMIVALSPLANSNALALAGSSFNALSMSLSSTTLASDSQTFRTRPAGAGGTNFAMLSLTESLATVGGDLRVNGNDIQNSAGSTNITMSSDRSITTVTSDLFRVEGASPSTQYFSVGKSFDGDVVMSLSQTRATQGYENAVINFQTQRSADGINYTPTQNGDTIGEFKFNGNAYTSTSPGVPGGPGASIQAQATETWTSTANGTQFDFQAVKTGTLDNYSVIKGTPSQLDLNADNITFNTSTGTLALRTVPITGYNPNVDFTGNIVKGAIRAGAGEATGDIWQAVGPVTQSTGISIDNTDKPADRTSLVIRNYGAGLAGAVPRLNVIGEAARGTADTPLNLNNNNVLIDVIGNGYTNTGWATDLGTVVPSLIRLATAEAWTNGLNNVGTNFQVLLQPTATALTTTSLQATIQANPQNSSFRSDLHQWNKGKSGQTIGMMNLFENSGKVNLSVTQNRANTSDDFALVNFLTQRSTDGVNYTATQNNDALGSFKFNGNAYTSTSPGVPGGPGAEIQARATETWTSTANGTQFNFFAIKDGTLDSYNVFGGNPDSFRINSNSLNIKNYDASTPLPGGQINYGRQYIEAYSTQDQTNPVANAENLMSFNNTGISNGISIVTNGTTLTRITMSTAGIYNIQFSAQLNHTTGGSHNAFIWLKKNGTAVANTAGDTRVAGNGERIMAAWNYVVSAAAGDYYELAWAADGTDVLLDYVAASAPIPAVPSVILTVVPVGA